MHPKSNRLALELLAVVCLGAVMTLAHHWLADPVRISLYKDEPRYINYALSLVEHQTFGISHDYKTNVRQPGAANTPAYPALLAVSTWLSDKQRQTLLCIQADPEHQVGCPQHFSAVLFIQYLLSIGTLAGLWMLARQLNTGSRWVMPVTTVILAMLSTELFAMARELRTEILVVPLFTWLLVVWHQLLTHPGTARSLMMGALLAGLTLTRPEYLYLTGFLLVITLCRGHLRKAAAPLVIMFLLTLSPWLLRNQIQVGAPVLTAASYGDTVLVQRLTYNRMDWSQWLAAFVYFIPDSGDRWSEALFPEDWYQPLKDTHPDAYMSHWPQDQQQFVQAAGDRSVLSYLLTQEVLPNAGWHIATSIPLAWRGLLVGKYWGMLGLIALCWWLYRDPQIRWWITPVGFLVALHAGVSISIPRYNIMLIIPYALAMAAWVTHIWQQQTGSDHVTAQP